MDEARVSSILKSVGDEAHQLLTVDERRDFSDVKIHLFDVAWSHFNSQYDSDVLFKNYIIPEAERLIDARVFRADNLLPHPY